MRRKQSAGSERKTVRSEVERLSRPSKPKAVPGLSKMFWAALPTASIVDRIADRDFRPSYDS
jgi:hypothetical protein